MMQQPGDIISYLQMCAVEGINLQRGMNYRLRGKVSIILMSIRPGAPYADQVMENGKVLLYEGHDVPSNRYLIDPKTIDQPMYNPSGSLTQNGLFYQAALDYKAGNRRAEIVKVYEKLRSGIWVYNGPFQLVDAWQVESGGRSIFKFRLELCATDEVDDTRMDELEHNRLIPTAVKLEVWKRDGGRCVTCGSTDNLHFDHIIPYSKGGSSLVVENIQLLCARHNLEKSDNII